MKSEVEALIKDTSGALCVSLIVPCEDKLQCINRAGTHRKFPKNYEKANASLSWEALISARAVHCESLDGDNSKPYKSILCMPLTCDKDEDTIVSIGVISIDHPDDYIFFW